MNQRAAPHKVTSKPQSRVDGRADMSSRQPAPSLWKLNFTYEGHLAQCPHLAGILPSSPTLSLCLPGPVVSLLTAYLSGVRDLPSTSLSLYR